jgi:hypothetical protein
MPSNELYKKEALSNLGASSCSQPPRCKREAVRQKVRRILIDVWLTRSAACLSAPRRSFAFLACTFMMLAAGCSRQSSTLFPAGGPALPELEDLAKLPGNLYQVTYNDQVVKLDRATVHRALRRVSGDHMTFLFDKSSPDLSQLAPGKILLLQGLALRKITAISPLGVSLLEVHTERTALADAISEGEVRFSYPVSFAALASRGPLRASRSSPRTLSLLDALWTRLLPSPATVWADSGNRTVAMNGKFEDWDYNISATPSFNRLDVKSAFKKQFEAAMLEVNASGFISDFETKYDLVVRDRGNWKFLDWKNKNMNGNLSINWSAYYIGTGPMTQEQRLSFLFPYPLEVEGLLGDLPVTLKFGGAMLFKPGFTGKGELARGKFQVDYTGVEGFSMSGGNTSPDGEVHGDGKIIEAPALSAIGPEGFINGFALPRIELSLESDYLLDQFVSGLASNAGFQDDLKSSADAYAEVVVVSSIVAAGAAASPLTPLGYPNTPCEQVQLLITGKIGAKVEFLSKDLFTGPVELEIFHHGIKTNRGCRGEQ